MPIPLTPNKSLNINILTHIICYMLEIIKRWGPYLLTASAAFTGVGFVPYLNGFILASIIVWCLAFLCLISALYALITDIIRGCRKDKEQKNSDSRPHWPI